MRIENFNKACNSLETAFNMAECVPVLGAVTSAARAKLGVMQTVAGLACMIFGAAGGVAADMMGSHVGRRKCNFLTQLGAEHVLHGALNAIRGFAVLLISSQTGGIGNIVMLIPNVAKDGVMFAPFFLKYGEFAEKSIKAGSYLIFD